jgi:hypothetical protein
MRIGTLQGDGIWMHDVMVPNLEKLEEKPNPMELKAKV